MATSVITSHVFGTKDVAVSGTAVQLDATDYTITELMLIAHDDNPSRVYYGGSDVASSTQRGIPPGGHIVITSKSAFLLSALYINGDAGAGVDFVAVRGA